MSHNIATLTLSRCSTPNGIRSVVHEFFRSMGYNLSSADFPSSASVRLEKNNTLTFFTDDGTTATANVPDFPDEVLILNLTSLGETSKKSQKLSQSMSVDFVRDFVSEWV